MGLGDHQVRGTQVAQGAQAAQALPGAPAAQPVPLPVRTAADTEGEVHRVLTKLDAAGAHQRLLRLLANSATGFRPFVLLTSGLLNSPRLPRTVQEVVILHLAARLGIAYEWWEHVPMAVSAGVPEELVERIWSGGGVSATDPVFGDGERVAVRFADRVLDGAGVGGELWDAAAALWGDEGALDLLMTVGVWGAMVPTVVTGLGLTPGDGAAATS